MVLMRASRSSWGNRFCSVPNTRSMRPPLRRIGRDMGDAELAQGTADLGELGFVDLAAPLGDVEVVGTAIGVERTEQAILLDRLGQAQKARHRAFLLDHEGRIDLPGGIVECDHEIEIAPHGRRGDGLEKRRRLMGDWAKYCASVATTGDVVVPMRKA
jgi:hypothetical protein